MSKVLQLLRNSQIIVGTRTDAINKIEARLNDVHDGEPVIVRYRSTEDAPVETILGIAYNSGSAQSYTYFEGDSVTAALQALLDKHEESVGLDADGNHITTGGNYTSGATTIAGEIAALDTQVNNNAIDIAKLNADDNTAGSVAKSIKDAVEALDSEVNATAGKFVTGVKIENGKLESVAEGGLSSTNSTITITNGFDIDANIDGTTIVKDDNGVLSVASSALTQYVGSEAIKVSDVDANNKKTISLKLHEDEKILSQSDNGLISTLSLYYDSTAKEIQLKGIGGTVVSKFDSSAFVVDGMLDSVAFSTEIGKENILVFTFNTEAGKNAIEVDLSKYIDVYTAGNGIDISDHSVAVKLDSGNENTFLTVGANGLKLSGVQTAINNAIEALDMTAAVEAEDGEFINKIDEADGIVSATKGTFATTVEASYAEGAGKVAPTAKAVREAIAAKNVDAEGDDYVSATAANNKVTVATDVQDVSANAGTRGTWSVTDAGVATLTGETAPSINGVEKSLVDGKQAIEAVKTYVDAKVAVEAAERTAKIEGAVKALDAEVASMNGDVTAEKKVKVAITEVDGKLTSVAVTTSDIASAADLSNEVARAEAAEAQALADAKAYTDAEIQKLDVDNVTVATKDATGIVTLTKAVKEADGKIAAVDGADSTIALAKVATTGEAADVALTGYAKADSVAAVQATDSVKVALGKLEKKADSTLNEVEAGNGINVSDISGQKQTVSVKLDTTTATDNHPENALSVNANGLYLSSVWDCGEY